MNSASSAKPRIATAAVSQIVVHHVRVPLRKAIKHASHTRSFSDNVIVECTLRDGTVGYGEGVPRDYVTGETIEDSLSLIRDADWSPLQEVHRFEEAIEMIQQWRPAAAPGDDRGCVGNAARCAVELALLDAFGRFFGVSLVRLLDYLPEFQSIHAIREKCRYSGVITSKSELRERVSAWKQRIYGFRQCKIKVGTAGQNDVARLRTFRRILGKRMNLRIDANEAWSPESVAERILELEPFGVTSVEQPVAHENVDCLRAVREQVRTPIMLDESLCSFKDGQTAIERKTCDLFNIRLSKCGGLLSSFKLAQLAQEHGLGYQLGCQVGETGILSAAGRHFACSVGGIRYLEGSYDSHLVRERLTREDLTFSWGGVAPAITSPGLGITVDGEALQRISISKDQVYG
jgi:L-alanine-DL-glutamate epimerase-like enolase superfamily enzyme